MPLQLENLKIEVRKSSSQQHTKAKEKTGDAKKIQALERQVNQQKKHLQGERTHFVWEYWGEVGEVLSPWLLQLCDTVFSVAEW